MSVLEELPPDLREELPEWLADWLSRCEPGETVRVPVRRRRRMRRAELLVLHRAMLERGFTSTESIRALRAQTGYSDRHIRRVLYDEAAR